MADRPEWFVNRTADNALALVAARKRIAELESRAAGQPEMCACGHTLRSHVPGECVGCHKAGEPFPLAETPG